MRALLLLALVGCGDKPLGDGVALGSAGALTIVAHTDDDLVFMQPDLLEAGSGGVTNVYVIAASDGEEDGVRSAYASATGHTLADWKCGVIALGSAANVEHCRLDAAALSLVFLGYPDGGEDGSGSNSLLQLFEGKASKVTAATPRATTYDEAGLIDVLASMITTTAPDVIRTLDIGATHGPDASDHLLTGTLALLADAQAGGHARLISYRGENVIAEAANTAPELVAQAAALVERHDACAAGCATCGDACGSLDATRAMQLARRYAIGFRPPFASAQIRLPSLGQCLAFSADGDVRLADCATAPAWALTAGGAIQSADRCVQRLPTGELIAAHCDPAAVATPDERWFLDDEGHFWSGSAPAPIGDLSTRHLSCLGGTMAGGRANAALCGDTRAPVWELVRPVKSSGASGLTLGGARLGLGDVDGDHHADLLVVVNQRLRELAGAGDGTFAATSRDVGALGVEPSSLAVGDVDGDGRADACGRSPEGVLCLLGADATGTVLLWTHAFARAAGAAPDAVDRSFSIAGGLVCARDATGFACAARDADAVVVSASAPANAALWAADLDRDGAADWCAPAVQGGYACGLAAERAVAPEGGAWSFSNAGTVDGVTFATTTSAFGDVDGDGRADACDLQTSPNRVACARSQGHGFGPRFVVLSLDGAQEPTDPPTLRSLAIGDLDGDGRADLCSAEGPTLLCALTP